MNKCKICEMEFDKQNGYADALLKYKCMMDNNVQILTSKELKELNIL